MMGTRHAYLVQRLGAGACAGAPLSAAHANPTTASRRRQKARGTTRAMKSVMSDGGWVFTEDGGAVRVGRRARARRHMLQRPHEPHKAVVDEDRIARRIRMALLVASR